MNQSAIQTYTFTEGSEEKELILAILENIVLTRYRKAKGKKNCPYTLFSSFSLTGV